MDQISEQVRYWRKARGLSVDALGKQAGYTNGTMISQIEQGIKKPSYTQLKAIARALEVSVSVLADGEAGGCRAVTNHANGTHAIGYQHNEGALLMTDELQAMVRQVVREELTVQREQLVQDMRVVVREAAKEADDAAGQGEEG